MAATSDIKDARAKSEDYLLRSIFNNRIQVKKEVTGDGADDDEEEEDDDDDDDDDRCWRRQKRVRNKDRTKEQIDKCPEALTPRQGLALRERLKLRSRSPLRGHKESSSIRVTGGNSVKVRNEEAPKNKNRLSLTERLNLRSRSPTNINNKSRSFLTSDSQGNDSSQGMKHIYKVSLTSQRTDESLSPGRVQNSSLSDKLHQRTRPVVQSPQSNANSTPPVDLDQTPEPPRTPLVVIRSDDGIEDMSSYLNMSNDPSLTFSTISQHNMSIVSSQEKADDEEEVSDRSPGNDEPSVDFSNLDYQYVDHLQQDQQADEAMDCDQEPMDWDQIDPGLLQELQNCRREVRRRDDLDFKNDESHLTNLDLENTNKVSSELMVVVDTNIFISQLSQVNSLLQDEAFSQVVLYIPWAVMRELDTLKAKASEEVKKRARDAINFLYKLLGGKSPRVRGQTGKEEKEAEVFAPHNADDRILQTCLKLTNEATTAVLYTNDKNLANKALISGIEAFSSIGLLEGLSRIVPSTKAVQPASKLVVRQILSADTDGAKFTDADDEREAAQDLFGKVWQYIHAYTWKYCQALNIPFLYPEPDLSFRTTPLSFKDCDHCLMGLLRPVLQLWWEFYAVISVPLTDLSVTCSKLTSFYRTLVSFLDGQQPPLNQPVVKSSHYVSPRALLAYLLHHDTRQLAVRGFDQLSNLRVLLQECRYRLRAMKEETF